MESILEVADAVMVARGDLGVEVSLQVVPIYQKNIIKTANKVGKPVIILLICWKVWFLTLDLPELKPVMSPMQYFRGRLCNAVCGNATGEYPFEAVSTMSKIAKE